MSTGYITEKTSITQPKWLTLIRIALGFILFWKSILFIRNTTILQLLIHRTGIGIFTENSAILTFIIPYLSLLCGLFILCGLFTRTSSIIQIPILFIAVFFVNVKSVDNSSWEFVLSIIVLLLLILFAIIGSGTISADEFFRTYYKAGSDDGNTKRFFKS